MLSFIKALYFITILKLKFCTFEHFVPLDSASFYPLIIIKKNDSVRQKKKRLFVLEYRKRHFPALYCRKKNSKKGPLLDQNHGLAPLKKCQFFDYLNFLFYSQERRFFVAEYRKRHFPGLYYLKRKSCKNGHFSAKTMG